MFRIARESLERIAPVNAGYRRAASNSNKLCHGLGMFQYDIQFFKSTPAYFLNGQWKTLRGTVGKGVAELKTRMAALYDATRRQLTHDESVYLAIAYNQGAAHQEEHGDQEVQGYKDEDGVYYCEHIDANLKQMRNLF
jgi:hypothetical protein